MRALFFLREYFFPSDCALCGTALISAEETWYGLCEDCRGSIEAERALDHNEGAERCDRCGRPLVSERGRCLPCRNSAEGAFDRIIALFPYAGSYRRLLSAYKFGKNLALGNFLAEQIQAALEEFGKRVFLPGNIRQTADVVIVPVPPRPGKIKHAGWDQVEHLAKLLEKGWGKKVFRCLKRLPSKVQKELSRQERQTNLRGRITLKSAAPKTALLIDDVMTTGSTMDVCAAVLKTGGAERVYGLCLFYN
jgi:ComF family protein